jgi:hypothetical protein
VCSPAAGVRVIAQVFRASGPYQPSPGLVTAVVECVGGGAGGGDVAAVTGISGGGGGGGSGGYSRTALAAALVAGGVNVVVGAGGGPQANGGVTSFGAFCVANGGLGGTGFAGGGGIWGQPGFGASPGVGDIAFAGNAGTPGQNFDFTVENGGVSVIFAGMGGASVFGGSAPPPGAGPGVTVIGEPTGGLAPGAGGVGNVANQSDLGSVQPGAPGAAGICIVTEYCWADSGSSEDDCCDPRTLNVNARVAVEREPGWGPGPRSRGGPSPGFLNDPSAYNDGE